MWIETRLNHPPDIHDVCEEDHSGDRRERGPRLFHFSGEKEKKRPEEMEEDKKGDYPDPATGYPVEISCGKSPDQIMSNCEKAM